MTKNRLRKRNFLKSKCEAKRSESKRKHCFCEALVTVLIYRFFALSNNLGSCLNLQVSFLLYYSINYLIGWLLTAQ
jgi:hypothetical protein